MPTIHLPTTPERLLSSLHRSDSKDPSTTCRGLTTAGKQCRNPLKLSLASTPSTPTPHHHHSGSPTPAAAKASASKQTSKTNNEAQNGVVSVGDRGQVVFYCWRHKEQAISADVVAEVRGEKTGRGRRGIVELEGRTSVDTLVDRLGGLDTGEKTNRNVRRRESGEAQRSERKRKETQHAQVRRRHRRPTSFWASLCCLSSSLEKESAPMEKPRPVRADPNVLSPTPTTPMRVAPNPSFMHRPAPMASPSSQTQTLLSFIPTALSPQTTSALLTELAKPLADKDEEGYIYIYWLQREEENSSLHNNPSSSSDPTASSLSPHIMKPGRRTSEIIRQASTAKPRKGTASSKILLKIGRASNVHRRMHEWARQCGYTPCLIRWYPYISSSSSLSPASQNKAPSSPSHLTDPSRSTRSPQSATRTTVDSRSGGTPTAGRKVPHVQKVERLIHVELGALRVMHRCEACGKEHREWFEVEATREGVKMVDTVARRWVAWAEGER